MKKCLLAIFLLVLGIIYPNTWVFSQDLVEVNLTEDQIRLIDFNLGGYKVNGEFGFKVHSAGELTPGSGDKESSLIVAIKGRKIAITPLDKEYLEGEGDKGIPWLEAKLILRGKILFIPYLYSPQFVVKGEVDLAKNQLNLDLEGSWIEESEFLKGEINLQMKAWGGISSFLLSGYLVMDGGEYKGKEFSHLRIDFLGRPPVLNITDSQLVFESGNVVEIKGVLDLRDFSDILPGAEYEIQKVFIDQWQLFSEDDSKIGLKKQLDEKFNVFVNTDSETENSSPKTELRYNWKDDKFLRLRMEEEGTSLRLEKRRDF
ncbi:MAG: hypothetical protein ABIE75_03740 [Candidatus Omnitrophota bacterium]